MDSPFNHPRSHSQSFPCGSNTVVMAASELLNLKGRDSGIEPGSTSGAKKMTSLNVKSTKTSRRNGRTARIGGLFAVLALIVSVAAPMASRASADHAPSQAVFGTVVEVTPPDTLVLATDAGVVTLLVLSNDVFIGSEATAFSDISVGDRVIASAHEEPDGTLTADRVLVRPDRAKPVNKHILGVVVESGDGTVVVQDRDGNSVTIEVPEGVELPDVGIAVTAIARLDRVTGKFEARAFDFVADAVERLKEAADRVSEQDREFKAELKERLKRAREQHLSALNRAQEALERARQTVAAVQVQLREVSQRFAELKERYEREAKERNQRVPNLRANGTIRYDENAWGNEEGEFSLTPRGAEAGERPGRVFAWDAGTLVIVPVEQTAADGDPDRPVVTGPVYHESKPAPLNTAKELVENGARIIVQYDSNTEPPLAKVLIVLPPQLDDELDEAIEREELHNVQGIITLVEQTASIDELQGIVVLANRKSGRKVVARITTATVIEVDGEVATFGDLAAGMAAEIEFIEFERASEDEALTTVEGRLNAKKIRARTKVDDDEVHVAGVIVGLDLTTRTIGIRPRSGEVIRAHVVDDAEINKDGEKIRFRQLEVGDLVLSATRFNRRTIQITRLAVHSPRAVKFSGTITGVGHNPSRITVTTADGDVRTMVVTDETEIRSEDRGRIKFEDLTVGLRVLKGNAILVGNDDRRHLMAVELLVGVPRVATARGVVTRVDADAGELRMIVRKASLERAEGEVLKLFVDPERPPAMFKNGERIRSLAAVQRGDIVESVSVLTASRTILKLSVASPNLHQLRGVVVRTGEQGRALVIETSNGRMVSLGISNDTRITYNGRRVDSLEPVERGDVVSEAVFIASPDLPVDGVALRLTIFSRRTAVSIASAMPVRPDGSSIAIAAPVLETTVSGVIDEIKDDVWVIAGHKFRITRDTKIFGEEPHEGLVAKAALKGTRDAGWVAVTVSVAGRPDTNPTTRPVEIELVEDESSSGSSSDDRFKISGNVLKLERLRDGTVVVVIDGQVVRTNADTRVSGSPEIGGRARAVVRRTADGVMIVIEIEFKAPEHDDADSTTSGDSDSTSVDGTVTDDDRSGEGSSG